MKILSFLNNSTINRSYLYFYSIILFIFLFIIGLWISFNKPLWNDEIYTQIFSIDSKSYADILFMRLFEGNSNPLFYLSQKGICDFFHYKFPFPQGKKPYIYDRRSQIVLRLGSNILMSLSLSIIFYFFSRFYSIWIGCYVFLSALISPMVWLYWAEARPYAMWFFLTTVEILLFISILINTFSIKSNDKGFCDISYKLLIALSITHILLSLTIVISLAQIVIISFLLLITLGIRHLKWYIFITFIPVIICLFYYLFSAAPLRKYSVNAPLSLIAVAFPLDKIIVLGIYCIVGICLFIVSKWNRNVIQYCDLKQIKMSKIYIIFTILMIAAAFVFIGIYKMQDTKDSIYTLNNRYFINLTPVSIIAAAMAAVGLLDIFRRDRWMFSNVIVFLVGMLVIGAFRSCAYLMSEGLFPC